MNRRRILRGAATVFGTGPFALHAINSQTTAIEVVGIGSAGNSVVERIVADGMVGIESTAMDADVRALLKVDGPGRVLLGASTTKGLGCRGDPEIGRLAAIKDRPRIEHALCGASRWSLPRAWVAARARERRRLSLKLPTDWAFPLLAWLPGR